MAQTGGIMRAVKSEVAVVDELAALLFGLDPSARTTAAMTAHITRQISRWAVERGWSPHAEARVKPERASGDPQGVGYVDLVIRRGGEQPDLAIEIDSTDKAWSLEKLRHAAAAGMHAIWVRWGDEVWAGSHADVDVIQLSVQRRALPRNRDAGQLTLGWPDAPPRTQSVMRS